MSMLGMRESKAAMKRCSSWLTTTMASGVSAAPPAAPVSRHNDDDAGLHVLRSVAEKAPQQTDIEDGGATCAVVCASPEAQLQDIDVSVEYAHKTDFASTSQTAPASRIEEEAGVKLHCQSTRLPVHAPSSDGALRDAEAEVGAIGTDSTESASVAVDRATRHG